MAKLKVLVVENTVLLRMNLEDTLQTLGHEVVGWAATVSRAIAEAERLRPDVVLMDIELDDHGDGTEAAREICERFNIPSLFITGGVDHETWRRAMLTRPVGYLQKPVLPSELGALLDNLSPSPAVVTSSAEAVQAAVELLQQPVQPSPSAAQVSAGEPPLAKPKPEPDAGC